MCHLQHEDHRAPEPVSEPINNRAAIHNPGADGDGDSLADRRAYAERHADGDCLADGLADRDSHREPDGNGVTDCHADRLRLGRLELLLVCQPGGLAVDPAL